LAGELLPHDPPAKLERAIIALSRAWHTQALLSEAHQLHNEEARLEAKRCIDPFWHAAWSELGAALDDLKLWDALR
jgi:hypothetical protein